MSIQRGPREIICELFSAPVRREFSKIANDRLLAHGFGTAGGGNWTFNF